MISVEKAVELILAQAEPLPAEMVAIVDAPGRFLAEPVAAPRDLPPRDNSAMDGYAFSHPGKGGTNARFKVVEEIAAGHPGLKSVGDGEASKIMTGAPIPAGADTVIQVEECVRDGEFVTFNALPAKGANVRRAGEDVREGMMILPSGTRVRPAEIGMLAAMGRSYVRVHRRPRVAILATGDEIVEIDRIGKGDMIVNSNSHGLWAQICEAGGEPVMLGIGRDDPEGLLEMLARANGCEIVVTTGGVSMGDYDYVPEVLERWGVELKVRKVAMKPGKPVVFGRKGGVAVFGLPGNPVSAMVSFEQFVRPLIRKLCGATRLFRPVITAVLDERAGGVRARGDRMEFIRCRVEAVDGRYLVTATKARESGMLSTLVKANGLMILDPEVLEVRPGDSVPVQVYDYEFLEGESVGW